MKSAAAVAPKPFGRAFTWAEGAFTIRLCLAAVLAFLAAEALGLGHGYSAALSAIIVMRPYQQGALKAGALRLLATLGGLAAAYGAMGLRHLGLDEAVLLGIVLLPLAALAAYDQSWRTAMISAVLMLAIPAQSAAGTDAALGRALIVGLGAVVGIFVSVLVLPRPHTHVIQDRALRLAHDLLTGLVQALQGGQTPTQRDKAETRLRRRLMELGQMVRETRTKGEDDPAALRAGLVRHLQAVCLLLRSEWRRAELSTEQVGTRLEMVKSALGQLVNGSAESDLNLEALAGPEKWLFGSLVRDVVALKRLEAKA